jgi:dipeptidyl aminopeptidase/acylaminoacyl peptidase
MAIGWVLCAMPLRGAGMPPVVPVEDLFRNPEQASYTLSPSGDYIAWLAPWQSRLNIHVQAVGSDDVVRVTNSTERDIYFYGWGNDDTLVYVQDSGGDENYRLFAAQRDGSGERVLTPFDAIQARIVDLLRNDPAHMIVALNNRDPRLHDAYRLNIETGELTLLVENPGYFSSYLCDNAGVLRIATATDGVNTSLFYRATDAAPFSQVLTTDFRVSVDPLFFTFDNRHLYASSNLGRDKQAIVVLDPQTGAEVAQVYEHPAVDVTTLLRSEARQRITGVRYTFAKTDFAFFDEESLNRHIALTQQFAGLQVRITATNHAETRFIVAVFDDRQPASYHLYDAQTGATQHLADSMPWLTASHLAAMRPIQFQSRDGLTIHGYLTLPTGLEPRKLPVVVNPHGGPWARDYWGFNPEVQLLANRGYAVLQLNFRGSTGFGRAFWEASFGEWGRAMQDDVTDGVAWLVGEGIADPARVAIYGASYGGYKTLAGLTFTPDLFAAGISYVGVSNLLTFMGSIPPYWEQYRQMLYAMVGNPDDPQQLAALQAASPVNFVDRIQVPLLIAQGANDPRVVKAESDQMVEALRARGIDVPYMVKWNEGHGFSNEENQFEFYRAMEQFFHRHLGGRMGLGDDVLGGLYNYVETLSATPPAANQPSQ